MNRLSEMMVGYFDNYPTTGAISAHNPLQTKITPKEQEALRKEKELAEKRQRRHNKLVAIVYLAEQFMMHQDLEVASAIERAINSVNFIEGFCETFEVE